MSVSGLGEVSWGELGTGETGACVCPRFGFLRHRVTPVICGSELRLCRDAASSGRVTGRGGVLSPVTRMTGRDAGSCRLRHGRNRWSATGFGWLVTWVTQGL